MGPGSRVQSALGRGLVYTFSPAQYRLPGRGRPARPRSGAHARSEAEVLFLQACKCWNVGEGFKRSPTGRKLEAGHGALAGHKLRATGHRVTITTYYAPRASRGGHTGPPLRRDELQATSNKLLTATTNQEPQLQATSYEPLATLFRFHGRGRIVRPRSGAHAGREAEALL